MSWTFTGILLAAFGLSLILVTISLRLLRGVETAEQGYSPFARFFLIALRVAIGWHCFVEGMEKLSTPNWSSEGYLRESMGPLSEHYRSAAGDRLIDKLTLGPNDAFPEELEREWRTYYNAFAAYHDLDADQLKRAEMIYDQRKSDTLTMLRSKKETVVKPSQYPPELPVEWNMAKRLEEHERLQQRVRDLEAQFPTSDTDAHAEWKRAKADLAKWRGELKKVIDAETNKLKKLDKATEEKVKKAIEGWTALLNDAKALKKDKEDKVKELQAKIDEERAKLWAPLGSVLSSAQLERPPMPEPKTPVGEWRLLEWSNFLVKWSLIVLGATLMLGLCTRCSTALTALMILSFYLAMPPLPGWPESPRLEGHYLLINKTLIEVIALFALTFIPTGRWAGIDGLFAALCCRSAGGSPAPN